MTPPNLSYITRQDFEALLSDLASEDPAVQESSKKNLDRLCRLKWQRGTTIDDHLHSQAAQLQNSVVVSCLLEALRHGHPRARVFAAEILWVAREKSAVPALIECLNADHKDVRLASAHALGHLADLSAVDPLLRLLTDPEVKVRGVAAASLGKLGDDRAVPALLALLQSKVWRDRSSALFGLSYCLRTLYGHTPRPPAPTAADALPAIRQALADPHMRVRRSAKSALTSYDSNRRHSAYRNPES